MLRLIQITILMIGVLLLNACNSSSTPDTTAPVITLNGSNPVSVVQFTTYTDAGATATDNVDGAVAVTSTNDINLSQVGTYTVTYTATDAAGNSATATRTVNVTAAAFSITHNGTNYGTVTSPYTGRIWLDRNLGAARVCTALNDTACYGDYYQWGRNFDGHQDSLSGTTTTLATNVTTVGHGNFITHTVSPFDWASIDSNGSIRAANWSKTDGSSVCPVGFRVPTLGELKAELIDPGSAQIANNTDAFNSFLKLPSAGYRLYDSAGIRGSWHNIWSSSPNGLGSHQIGFDSGSVSTYNSIRAYGFSVRCIKN